MKVAVVDKNKEQLNALADEICSHYFPEEDIFVYKFMDNTEFIDFLYQGLQYKFVFLDDDTCDLITIKTVQELLPSAMIIGLTEKQSFIPLNNYQVLTKPYQSTQVLNTLLYAMQNSTIKPEQIKVFDGNRIRYLDTNAIYYFESYYGKVYVHTYNNKYLAENPSLYQYENMLHRYGFVSIHKSIIVNMNKVRCANLDEYTLRNDEVIYASARKKHKAFKTYTMYIEEKEKFNVL